MFFPCLVNTEKFGRRSPLNKLSSIFWNHWTGCRVRSLDWFDLTNPPFLGHHPVYFFLCFWPNNKNCQLRVGFGLDISSHLNKASSQLLFTHKLAKIQHQSLDQTLVLISPPKFSPKSSPKFSFKSSTILHPSLELANIGQLELELSNYLHQPHQSSLLTELVTWGQGQAIQSEEEETCTLARGNCLQPGLEKICWSAFKMIRGNIHHFPLCLVLAQQSQPRSTGPGF